MTAYEMRMSDWSSDVCSSDLDHADWLCDTRDSVAYEKAGIMRDGVPALCGDLNVPGPLLEHAESLKSPLFLRGRDFDLALDPHSWHWRGVGPGGEPLELHDLPLLSVTRKRVVWGKSGG